MRSSLIGYLCVSMILLPARTPGQNPNRGAPTSAQTSPVGQWRTIDDATGKAQSLVVIWEESGKLYGKIERLLDPQDPDPRCGRCEGAIKGRPLVGLRILWHLRKDGNQWSGGKVLDPDNGKVYRCYITVEGGGKKLKVRGFIGFSLLGRTQYWLRDE